MWIGSRVFLVNCDFINQCTCTVVWELSFVMNLYFDYFFVIFDTPYYVHGIILQENPFNPSALVFNRVLFSFCLMLKKVEKQWWQWTRLFFRQYLIYFESSSDDLVFFFIYCERPFTFSMIHDINLLFTLPPPSFVIQILTLSDTCTYLQTELNLQKNS